MSKLKVYQIFLAEDNPADVYLLRYALKQAGLSFELSVVEDGAKALEYVRNYSSAEDHRPDLAVLDLNLPTHGGIEVLAEIRQTEALSEVPVVVLTSSAAPLERSQVEQLRVARFITKPPDLATYLKIGEVLKEVLLGSEPCPAIDR